MKKLTYAELIEKQEELLKEISSAKIEEMAAKVDLEHAKEKVKSKFFKVVSLDNDLRAVQFEMNFRK